MQSSHILLTLSVLCVACSSRLYAVEIYDEKPATDGVELKRANRSVRFLEDYVVEDDNTQEDQAQDDQEFLHPYSYSNFRRHQPNQHYETTGGTTFTREILIKQGRLKGIVKSFHPEELVDVDQFLGIPYAEAPVGSKRFMPPGAPPPWNGLLVAGTLPPVCPQNLPNLDDSNKFSKGRYNQLKRLVAYLKIEKEDCLYLNMYVPSWGNLRQMPKFPVIVFIHGESYEWNSGNPYDGSVLASYGQVIVITVNYRLGVLGFMKPGINEHTVSNFGLLDQIAALQWIKDNIAAFGGDAESVTLLGHGTGAACVNLMMVSPIAKELFRRAILMSGSALSDWATTQHPFQFTMQIANSLNCPFDDEQMADCLRKKRYTEILKAKPTIPQFSTPFGPVVDNLVVPNTPHKTMGQYIDMFSRYDLMFGVTELESYHILNMLALNYGLLEHERDNILRFYMQNRYEIRPDLALAATLREYTEIYVDPNKALADEHRDTLLEILSDARVAAPVVQTGVYHAKVNPRSYMYVFAHNSELGEYARLTQSVVGEELPYVFGAPFARVGPFPTHYTDKEKLLSEAVMKYWTNFAKTGNPKAPWKDHFLTLRPADWEPYDIDWPEFNGRNQSYLNLGIPPAIGYQYRQKFMKFWNNDLPEELTRNKMTKPFSPYPGLFTTTPGTISKQTSIYYPDGHVNLYPHSQKPYGTTEDPYKLLKGLMSTQPHDHHPHNLHGLIDEHEEKEITTASTSDSSFYILIGVLALFFIGNLILLLGYLWKKGVGMRKLKRGFDDTNTDVVTDEEFKRSKLNETDDSFIMDIVRKSGNNTYEPVKTSYSPINGFKLTRQTSTSTVDPHTKVVDWIAQEITKYSPKIQKKITQANFLGKTKIVSVGIDATPQGRSNSVLRQEPIEITKAKSFDFPICDEEQSSSSSTQDNNYVDKSVQISHKHSHSDPVPMYVHHRPRDIDREHVTSFIDEDINQTSRDENDYNRQPLSPEDALITIQRRNFPKVLPDFPVEEDDVSSAIKRRSLPAHTFLQHCSSGIFKVPPVPPPRTTSTLGRKGSGRRESGTLTTSPLMIAEEPPDVQEPEITSNTLIVGPLIPKSEGIYSTIKRNKALTGTTNQNYQQSEDDSPSRSKPLGKGEPKIIIKPTPVGQDCRNKTNIPRVTAPPDKTTDERVSPSSSTSSSNETECSQETVKPKY